MIRILALTLALTLALAAQPKAVADAKAKIKAGDYDAAITALDTALKTANAKDAPALKAALVDAYFTQGESTMFNDKLPPRMKYRPALKSFRKVLELDKNHAKAKAHIATIEGVYKSMGMPVPQ